MFKRLAIAFLFPVLILFADEPVFNPAPLAPTPVAEAGKVMGDVSARRAQAAGFSSIAAAYYEQLLAQQPESPRREEWWMALATARLEEGRFEDAGKALAEVKNASLPGLALRKAMLVLAQGDTGTAATILASENTSALSAVDLGWFDYLSGVLAEFRDDPSAGQWYDKAIEQSVSDLQRARFLLARERLRLLNRNMTEDQAKELADQAERYQGRRIGNSYQLQYAVALSQLGRPTEAVKVLQGLIGRLDGSTDSLLDDARLVLGLVAGPREAVGQRALEKLLADGGDALKQRAALQLLQNAANSPADRDRLRQLITQLLERKEPHRITEDLLLSRSGLGLASGDLDMAESDARSALERFPTSNSRFTAYSLLVQTMWELKKYRAVAGFASEIKKAAPDNRRRALFGLIMAEAYYRAGDYLNAASAYAASVEQLPEGVTPGAVIFQWVMSELSANQLDEAAKILDRMSTDPRFDALNRWQAEWNLARKLEGEGRVADALARVTRLRNAGGTDELPDILRGRMAWLNAHLALAAGQSQQALDISGQIIGELKSLDKQTATDLDGLARLLKAEALFAMKQDAQALAVLQQLRSELPGTDAMIRSYIVEAEHSAAQGNLVDAQRLYVKLVDDFKDNPYGAYALYEAAVNAERRGQDEYYEQAYKLLERLVTEYPKSDLVFYARFKQGDLARRLNDFGRAQITYELLVNRYPQHKDVLAAHLALAIAHRAQAGSDAASSHFESALTIFERLRDLPDAPVSLRLEAGYQYGDMVWEKNHKADAAKTAWWPLIETFLVDNSNVDQLDSRSRYWLAKTLLRMAETLETESRPEEAINAYEMIIQANLPGENVARNKIQTLARTS